MNSTKRRDSKNRVLRSGESQQKDGRYRYTYYIRGKQHCFYSWKLEDTDRLPQGKQPCESLRSQIKELNKSLEQGIAFRGNGITVLGLVEKYLAIQNANDKLKTSTKAGYRTSLKHIKEDAISTIRIDKVKKSDAKRWILSLQEKGFGYSTISSIHGVIKPAFQMAVDDDLLLKNPFSFVLTDLIADNSKKRDALSAEDQQAFLDFIKDDQYYSRYYDPIMILFETGLRIGEFCALTDSKIDMENRRIKVDVQLHKDKKGYYLESPKTKAGYRTVPMTDKTYESFKHLLEVRTKRQQEQSAGGQKGYLCFDGKNMPRYGGQWAKVFESIWERYIKEHRTATVKVTPHVCRHTFATNMVKKGMNPAILKQILGHDDISTTFAIYTHLKDDDCRDELERLGLADTSTNDVKKVSALGKSKIIDFQSWSA